MLKLEITSLRCEKDFLLSSLDEIDALIFKKQEESGFQGKDFSLKRISPTNEPQSAKKRVIDKEQLDPNAAPISDIKKEDSVLINISIECRYELLETSKLILFLRQLISVHRYDCKWKLIIGFSETVF